MHLMFIVLAIVLLVFFTCKPFNSVTKHPHSNVPEDVEATKHLIGNGVWAYLNVYSAQFEGTLSSQQQTAASNLIHDVLNGYPCTVCRIHAIDYLENHPLQATDAEQLQRWVFDFHHSVNTRLGKPEYSYDQFRKQWIIPYHECSSCSI